MFFFNESTLPGLLNAVQLQPLSPTYQSIRTNCLESLFFK